MKQAAFNKILKQHFRSLQKCAKHFGDKNNTEAVHDFRTGIKKLRAILRLLSCNGDGNIKIPGKLKKLYRACGELRDMQMFEEYLLQKRGDNELIKFVKEESSRRKFSIQKIPAQIILKASLEKLIAEIPENIDAETCKIFMNEKRKSCNNIFKQKKQTDESIHSLRKSLKDMVYVSEFIMNETHISCSYVFNKINISRVKKINHKLGLYNDINVFLSLLDNFSKDKNNPGLRVKLNHTAASMLKEKNKIFPSILVSLRTASIQKLVMVD